MIESTPVIEDTIKVTDEDTDTSEIGFKETPSDADIAEAKLEENADNQRNNTMTQQSAKLTNFELSSFAERPFKLYVEDNNGEIVYDFRLPIAAHDVSAGTLMLLDRTHPTFKTVEGAYQATKLQYQNELSESEMDNLIIKLANASGLEARELGQSIQITDIED